MGTSLKKAHAQLRFKSSHLMADRRSGEMELRSCKRKTSAPGNSFEGLKIYDWRKRGHRGNPAVK